MSPNFGECEFRPRFVKAVDEMTEDKFNMTVRKFLKEVGVTSQREIEKAVRKARDAGTLPAHPLTAKMTLEVSEINLIHVVEGEIDMEDAATAV